MNSAMLGEQLRQTAQASTESAQPYRRQIIGLPLQRSLFGQVGRVAATIGLPGLVSELDFPARLDENGDLFLDRSQVAVLGTAWHSWFTPETLERLYTTHAAACDDLVEASENVARMAPSFNRETTRLTEDLANRMALVLAFGVLSKFIPDVLLRALADAGDVAPPPFPGKSAGAELMQDAFALQQACRDLHYAPQRLQHEWPEVSAEVFQLVNDFCRRQTGFGPLAWDSPGYEDPRYVVRLIHSAFNEVDVEQVRQRLSFASSHTIGRSEISVSPKVDALRRVLGLWLDFLERETWYARRAFYVGMIPLLQQLAERYREEIPGFQTSDLLFLDLHELTAGSGEPAVIQARRQRYMENTDYLSVHGVDAQRLTTMLGSS